MTSEIFPPHRFEGLLIRRLCAALADFLIVFFLVGGIFFTAVLLAIISLGSLYLPLLWISFPLVDIFYTGITIGGKYRSTWGQRLFGIEIVDESDGGAPGYGRSFLFILCYYLLVVPTSHLLELIAFFNEKKRTIPDVLSGLVFVRRIA